MTTSWKDPEVYGRRNNKIIKYLETRLFKTKKDDPDAIVHYAAAIGSLTRQNNEIIKLCESYEYITKFFLKINKERKDEDLREKRF